MEYESKPFNVHYVAQVPADIYGREHGYKITVTLTPKEPEDEATGNQHILYDFGSALPIVEAQYLLDVMELLPNSSAQAINEISLIRFDSEFGMGVCAPVHPRMVTCSRGKTEI